MMAIAALFAVLTLLAIGWAVWREEHPAWERYAREHREQVSAAVARLPEARRAAVLAGLPRGPLQDYVPGARAVDRCRSCHRGIDEPALAGAPQPHTAHPGELLRDHPPSEFGCTVCHGGQGPNLSGVDAAHGRVPYWDQPLLPQRYLEASCGRCHRAAEPPTRAVLERGREMAERECDACHDPAAADAGNGAAPPLRHVGIQRSRRWLADYLRDPDSAHARHWSDGRLAPTDFAALVGELASRKGAETLLQGRLLYNERGCGGCHQIDGLGGVLGIELSHEGLRVPRQLDFRRMPVAGDVVAWQEAHLLKPGAVVAGTNMIDPKLRSEQVELLVTYVLSLYPSLDYDAWRPPDHDGFREEAYRADAARGEWLYGRYCAACHARNGRGGIDVVHGGYAPALFNETFLALADDEFLAFNIAQGREPRNMPSWRNTGGLNDADVMSIVRYLRSLPRAELPRFAPPFAGVAEQGRAAYGAQCAGCHGERGEGGVGPALALPGAQKASDEVLYATIAIGRPGTAMLAYDLPGDTGLPKHTIADLVAYLRKLPEVYDAQP